jgi:hypothetical protein
MPLLACTSPHLLAKSWGHQLISRLHNDSHKQWVYQNLVIHYKEKDGLTLADHHKILNHMEGYLLIDPETLLPQHRFLFDADFETLGGATSHCLLWLAEMEAAVATSHLALSGTLTPEATAYFSSTHPSCLSGAFLDVALDT